jgi:subtilase family serine protease
MNTHCMFLSLYVARRSRPGRRFSGLRLLVALLCTASLTLAAHAQRSVLTRHVREVTPNGQAPLVGHLPATQPMRLVLVLPLRNQAALDNFVRELYDPASASYRRFLTVEEFTARFGPSQEDYDSVIRFVEASGFNVLATSRNHVNLDVTGSVSMIERALHVTLGVYQHPTESRTFFAPDREPTLDLAVQLWHISGLDNYSTAHPALVRRDASVGSNASTGSGPSASFLGSDMRAAYYGGTLTGKGQSLGLFELLGTDLADLTTYYTNVGQTNSVPITLRSVDSQSTSCTDNAAGGYCDDTEQTLDMTQALGMAPGLSSLVMYIGTGGKSGQTVDDAGIFNAMATASPLNAQLSCSWYWNPADPNTDNPYFEEFAAQGQNLFDAAGDHEDWQISGSIWPSDNAYLVSVGGTDLDTQSAGGLWASETAWSDTGGGVSPNNIPIPSWQTATANSCSACSKTYRNGPDVSANANFTFYVCADQTACTANEYGGTSFAAPMWAGYLALTNEQAVDYGNKTLGFINPALYTIGLSPNYDTDFHDMTSGSNGYSATTGYDLATGWGSPNGAHLLNALAPPTWWPAIQYLLSPN